MAKDYRMMRVDPGFHQLVQSISKGTGKSSVDITKLFTQFQVSIEIKKQKKHKQQGGRNMFDLRL